MNSFRQSTHFATWGNWLSELLSPVPPSDILLIFIHVNNVTIQNRSSDLTYAVRGEYPTAVYYFSVLTFPTLERAPNVFTHKLRTACIYVFQYVKELCFKLA